MDVNIFPLKGAAGINLGDSEQEVLTKLGEPKERKVMTSGTIQIIYDKVKVWIGHESKVDQISVYKGYEGQTEEGIKVGLSKDDLKKMWGLDLAYHEDDYWEFMSKSGTLFNFEKDEKGEDVISAIYINLPE